MESVIERPSFSVMPHARGPVLAVLRDGIVVVNLRIDAATNWALARALRDAHEAQSALERTRGASDADQLAQDRVLRGR
jgi:hypothetical protein